MQLWAVIVDSFRESLDRKIFWVVLGITLIVILAMASVGIDGEKVSFLFGAWDTTTERFNPVAEFGRSALIGIVVYYLMSIFLGWIGIMLILVATASVFPSMMEGGSIDVILAKPISRVRLFLYKYLSSMVFVLTQATVFVVLSFLVMGLRWGVWAPGYLLSIPLLVLLFSYVYCVSVLVAVKTRSTVAAILISLGAWFAFACPKIAVDVFDSFDSLQTHKRLHQTARAVAWIPPKTGDIPYLAARWAEAGTSIDVMPADVVATSSPEEIARLREVEEREMRKSPWLSIGSSLLFEAVIVLWAMWVFTRQDY
jgi:ABC-type transport system involved in multi-copper enzyme maturation permease subunit